MDVQVSLDQKVCIPSGEQCEVTAQKKKDLVDFRPCSTEETFLNWW